MIPWGYLKKHFDISNGDIEMSNAGMENDRYLNYSFLLLHLFSIITWLKNVLTCPPPKIYFEIKKEAKS